MTVFALLSCAAELLFSAILTIISKVAFQQVSFRIFFCNQIRLFKALIALEKNNVLDATAKDVAAVVYDTSGTKLVELSFCFCLTFPFEATFFCHL